MPKSEIPVVIKRAYLDTFRNCNFGKTPGLNGKISEQGLSRTTAKSELEHIKTIATELSKSCDSRESLLKVTSSHNDFYIKNLTRDDLNYILSDEDKERLIKNEAAKNSQNQTTAKSTGGAGMKSGNSKFWITIVILAFVLFLVAIFAGNCNFTFMINGDGNQSYIVGDSNEVTQDNCNGCDDKADWIPDKVEYEDISKYESKTTTSKTSGNGSTNSSGASSGAQSGAKVDVGIKIDNSNENKNENIIVPPDHINPNPPPRPHPDPEPEPDPEPIPDPDPDPDPECDCECLDGRYYEKLTAFRTGMTGRDGVEGLISFTDDVYKNVPAGSSVKIYLAYDNPCNPSIDKDPKILVVDNCSTCPQVTKDRGVWVWYIDSAQHPESKGNDFYLWITKGLVSQLKQESKDSKYGIPSTFEFCSNHLYLVVEHDNIVDNAEYRTGRTRTGFFSVP